MTSSGKDRNYPPESFGQEILWELLAELNFCFEFIALGLLILRGKYTAQRVFQLL